jgi:hypothetical protein
MVARERFELSSAAPEAAMFDHCTTGLQLIRNLFFGINTFVRKGNGCRFVHFCFFNVSSMQWQSCALGYQSSQHHSVETMASSFFRNLLVQNTWSGKLYALWLVQFPQNLCLLGFFFIAGSLLWVGRFKFDVSGSFEVSAKSF